MRKEIDSLGSVKIPKQFLWGAQTQRAIENFPISGQKFNDQFIFALGHLKQACARANMDLGQLDQALGDAILKACDEIILGKLNAHFPVDVFQTGSGTSTNMNANEVIANRAIQILKGEVGSRSPVHPNDHVNMSQSSNDVIPTAIHIAASLSIRQSLIPALKGLQNTLTEKSQRFDHIIKTGRTHLQDAAPIRLGQVFSGYAAQARKSIIRAQSSMAALQELPLGGTAVGTGLNRDPQFPQIAISHLNQQLAADFYEAGNHFEANAARDNLMEVSGLLKTIAVSLFKIANDIRWLGSGPRNGLGEIHLPVVQPGSSIMPGKVNPVMAEALIMVTAQVIGYDAAITQCALGGNFELNTMMPLIANNLLKSIEWLSAGVTQFTDRCVVGIEADLASNKKNLDRSLAMAIGLAPVIGYDQAAEISKKAYQRGKTIREIAEEEGVLSAEELEKALDPEQMTEPGLKGSYAD